MRYTQRRPLVGIPSSNHDPTPGDIYQRFNANYPAALAAAGAIPVVVPLGLPDDLLAELFQRLDGLCLAGGPDIAPAEYGEQPHPGLAAVDPGRDAVELKLARWALEADMPVLGICRGVQLLNVAAGGTLYQDLPAQMPEAAQHSYPHPPTPWEQKTHAVRVAGGSRLAGIVGEGELAVNSFHHQAVRDVGQGLCPVAWAPDGVIEALEAPDARFTVAVQWHPEGMFRVDEAARRLFAAFAAAAAED